MKVALAPVFEGKDTKYWFDVNPYSYQQEILDNLKAEREIRGNYRNLVVAATGTGKTVISALDYRNFRLNNNRSRLLFVAHREEILKQSQQTFQGVLKDPNFGELFVGNNKPEKLDYLFCSIQTLNSRNFCESLDPEYFDYIVVDEFHHACAETYQKLLEHFKPKILLGLTATPERMDGKDTLKYFNGRIAAEIRLPEAIDRGLLVPFQYFGVTDTADLRSIAWKNGGYDKSELTNLYAIDEIAAEKRAENIYNSLQRYVTDINTVKGIGFCVSKIHAKFSNLFHWQSQSTTSDTSTTGQRYINHVENGSKVLLFVREYKKNALGTAPYTFLGPVEYVSHNGSRPMNIIWQLRYKIPAKYIKQTNKLVA